MPRDECAPQRLLRTSPTSPTSARQCEDTRLSDLIKQFWLKSGGVYGYRKVTDDMRDMGESCSRHRVYRLMRTEGLRFQTGYRRRPGARYSRPSTVVPNHVAQQFNVTEPNKIWVTDITYIRTHEGWLYLAVVLDLFSRQVIGWSMQPRMESELAINALLGSLAQAARAASHYSFGSKQSIQQL